MGNSNRDSLPAPQAATPNSPAFQDWLKSRQSAPAMSDCPASESMGSGSGCGGYGIGLISDDEASQERIKAIMRDIMEREKQR